ncbi:hypothetical protein [Rubrivirga sp. IMCC45206]|uniref:hypothetical protein n=1 Tax=Rubrivirga sp. IMCC45206 TaxID=3391614 RepID=UPI00398FA3B9
MRYLLVALIVVVADARAQPVRFALPQLVGADASLAVEPVLVPVDDESDAYVAGIVVDVVGVVGGSALAIRTAIAVRDAVTPAGLFAPMIFGAGAIVVIIGAAVAVASGVDLVHVIRGGDPWLARRFDSSRSSPIPPRAPTLY